MAAVEVELFTANGKHRLSSLRSSRNDAPLLKKPRLLTMKNSVPVIAPPDQRGLPERVDPPLLGRAAPEAVREALKRLKFCGQVRVVSLATCWRVGMRLHEVIMHMHT